MSYEEDVGLSLIIRQSFYVTLTFICSELHFLANTVSIKTKTVGDAILWALWTRTARPLISSLSPCLQSIWSRSVNQRTSPPPAYESDHIIIISHVQEQPSLQLPIVKNGPGQIIISLKAIMSHLVDTAAT